MARAGRDKTSGKGKERDDKSDEEEEGKTKDSTAGNEGKKSRRREGDSHDPWSDKEKEGYDRPREAVFQGTEDGDAPRGGRHFDGPRLARRRRSGSPPRLATRAIEPSFAISFTISSNASSEG